MTNCKCGGVMTRKGCASCGGGWPVSEAVVGLFAGLAVAVLFVAGFWLLGMVI